MSTARFCQRSDGRRIVERSVANLRYFFASERYSEDIDLDLIRPVPCSLEIQVDAALRSPALSSLLVIGDLTLAEHTSAKQTETTHRWKIGLLARGASAPVRSKVEFSNRGGEGSYVRAAAGSRAYLPELSLPADFDRGELGRWSDRVEDKRIRTMVVRRLRELLREAA